MLCHRFYALWHLPSIAYHSKVELSVSNAIERQIAGASANPYVMPADVHRLICPGAIKYCYDQKALSMEKACFPVEPHGVHAARQDCMRLSASGQCAACYASCFRFEGAESQHTCNPCMSATRPFFIEKVCHVLVFHWGSRSS